VLTCERQLDVAEIYTCGVVSRARRLIGQSRPQQRCKLPVQARLAQAGLVDPRTDFEMQHGTNICAPSTIDLERDSWHCRFSCNRRCSIANMQGLARRPDSGRVNALRLTAQCALLRSAALVSGRVHVLLPAGEPWREASLAHRDAKVDRKRAGSPNSKANGFDLSCGVVSPVDLNCAGITCIQKQTETELIRNYFQAAPVRRLKAERDTAQISLGAGRDLLCIAPRRRVVIDLRPCTARPLQTNCDSFQSFISALL
jgi:hypothetical protein